MNQAWYIVSHLATGWKEVLSLTALNGLFVKIGLSKTQLAIACGGIAVIECVHLLQTRISIMQYISSRPWWLRWSLYYGVGAAIFAFGVFGREQFIYFQF